MGTRPPRITAVLHRSSVLAPTADVKRSDAVRSTTTDIAQEVKVDAPRRTPTPPGRIRLFPPTRSGVGWPPDRWSADASTKDCALDELDVLGLQATVGLLGGELDLLALLEGAEAVALDVLVVHEELIAALVGRNETPPLLRVEELHGAGRHGRDPFRVTVGSGPIRRCELRCLPTAS